MIDEVRRECSRHGDHAMVVSVDILETVRQDLAELARRESLGDFQRHILGSIYVTEPPKTGFSAASIVIVAAPTPALARLHFTWKGQRTAVMLPAGYIDKESAPQRVLRYLSRLLEPGGFHLLHEPGLPRKLLAARSGLAAYGRNNLCYVPGMGSFLTLSTFFSDLPCAALGVQPLQVMDSCSGCNACQQSCPTSAIGGRRFLLDAERCLTFFNEAGGYPFPDWIPPDAHNSLYGCHRCQTACPANRDRLRDVVEPATFDEERDRLVAGGESLGSAPAGAQHEAGFAEHDRLSAGSPEEPTGTRDRLKGRVGLDRSVTIVDLTARKLIGLRSRANPQTVSKSMLAALTRVWEVIRRDNLKTLGLNVAIYDGAEEGASSSTDFAFVAGVLVDGEVAQAEGLEVLVTPSGSCAHVELIGDYALIPEVHRQIRDWCRANGRRLAGVNLEIYGHWTGDQSQARTDVYYLLR